MELDGVPSSNGDAPAVFVSYSRSDLSRIERLLDQLAQATSTWIDLERIAPTSDWWLEISGAIDRSSAVVALLSPSSLKSEICVREWEFARSGGKNVVPVVIEKFSSSDAPEWIGAIHWIDATVGSDASNAAEIVAATNSDVDWSRAHTSLLTKAREWEASNESKSKLLRGGDVATNERLLEVDRPAGQPQPSELHRRFVRASRSAKGRTTRMAAGLAVVVAIGAAVLSLVAMSQRDRATEARDDAVSAQLAAEASESAAETAREEAVESESAAEQQRERAVTVALGAEAERLVGNRPDLALGLSLKVLERSESEASSQLIRQIVGSLREGIMFTEVETAPTEVLLSSDSSRAAWVMPNQIEIRDSESLAIHHSLDRVAGYRVVWQGELDLIIQLAFDGSHAFVASATPGSSTGLDRVDIDIERDSRTLLAYVESGFDGITVLYQKDEADFAIGSDLQVEQWMFTASSVERIEVATFPETPFVEHASVSESRRHVGLVTGNKLGLRDPYGEVLSTATWESLDQFEPGIRPSTITVIDGFCSSSDEAAGCLSYEVVLAGEVFASNDRTGEVEWWSSNGETAVSVARTSTAFSTMAVESCGGEVLLSSLGGVEISADRTLWRAVLPSQDVVAAVCDRGRWQVFHRDGLVLTTPSMIAPADAESQSAQASWTVIDFVTEERFGNYLEELPGEVDLVLNPNGHAELRSFDRLLATSVEPVDGLLGESLSTVAASFGDVGTELVLSYGNFSGSISPGWVSLVTVLDDAEAQIDSWLFNDVPVGAYELSDGSIVGLFTSRGDYLAARWIQVTDENLIRMSCHVGARLPAGLMDDLGFGEIDRPSQCVDGQSRSLGNWTPTCSDVETDRRSWSQDWASQDVFGTVPELDIHEYPEFEDVLAAASQPLTACSEEHVGEVREAIIATGFDTPEAAEIAERVLIQVTGVVSTGAPDSAPAELSSCEGTDTSLIDGDLSGPVVCVFPWALAESTTNLGGGPMATVTLLNTIERERLLEWRRIEDGPMFSGYGVEAIAGAGIPMPAAQLLFDSLDACSGCSFRDSASPPVDAIAFDCRNPVAPMEANVIGKIGNSSSTAGTFEIVIELRGGGASPETQQVTVVVPDVLPGSVGDDLVNWYSDAYSLEPYVDSLDDFTCVVLQVQPVE